jgi:TetR/AcrR family transcriptional regulator, ethionamide resistance regulator
MLLGMAIATRREQARRSRHETRERIVAAATELIRERPYAELNVDEVMRAAGLGRTIFYRHFDDLGDLMLRVNRPALAELFEAQPRVEDIDPGDEEVVIRRGLEPAVAVYTRYGPLLRAMAEAAASDRELAGDQAEIRARFSDQAERYLRLAQARGAASLADVAETAHALRVMTEAYLLDAFGRGPRVSPEVALQTLSEIWLAMVRE